MYTPTTKTKNTDSCSTTARLVYTPHENAHPEDDYSPSQPSHYRDKDIEVIDYIEDSMSAEMFEGYLVGNCIKYISRYRKKNGVEDLEKCQVYLEWLIEHLGE